MQIAKLTFLVAVALASATAYTQTPAETMTTDALGKAEWVQGSAPTAWEPGKVYIIECWATWCGPCIAAIPHVDALYDKYKDKGLRVLGMDVFEDGKDKVAAFVKKKGDGMSYPVAYTGKGSAFEKEWLQPNKVNAIPHSFIVKGGRILLQLHPKDITEGLIDALLAGGETQEKYLQDLKASADKEKDTKELFTAYQEALKKGDGPAADAAFAKMKTLAPNSKEVAIVELEGAIKKQDWAAVVPAIDRISNDLERDAVLMGSSFELASMPGVSADLRKSLVKRLSARVEKGADIFMLMGLVQLQLSLGEKEGAKANINRAAERAKTKTAEDMGVAPAFFEKMNAAIDAGEKPTLKQMAQWYAEAMHLGGQ